MADEKVAPRNGGDKLIDMTGQKIGRLVVLERDLSRKSRTAYWLCQCDCWKRITVVGSSLRSGHTRSCGCLQSQAASEIMTTHGLSWKGSEYNIWKLMRRRCNSPTCSRYKDYGGRGIYVCKRWDDFSAFMEDMGPRPGKEYTLDRIYNDGPYSPGNCRWVTRNVQNRNTRRNVNVQINGSDVVAIDLAKALNMCPKKLQWRLRQGLPLERALSPEDLRSKRKRKR